MPGMYEAKIDFSPPPDGFFDYGPVFGDFSEEVEEMLSGELPDTGVFPGLAMDGDQVARSLFSTAYAVAAVQLAHAHEGVGLGVTRLLHHTKEDVYLPPLVTENLENLGETRGPDGRRWLIHDFPSTIDALARASEQLSLGMSASSVNQKFWLPVRVDDGRTATSVARGLSLYMSDRGFHFGESQLIGEVFSGTIPPTFAAIAEQLPVDERLALRLLFQVYSSEMQFLERFSSPLGYRALGLIGLEWDEPSLEDLQFRFQTMTVVKHRIECWKLRWKTFQSGLGIKFQKVNFRQQGDPWQMCTSTDRGGRVLLSSYYSFQRRNATFRACFGSPVGYHSVPWRMTALGRIEVRSTLVPLLRQGFGLD